ncbi:hypothetical protein [Aminicella lysinilytica]|uniref:Uncharacterized protein n=1 Tax=Aminicella lysinilytica TaxID=433323 RepID=A0A4R6Q146_9FIRM|nr:hypothetical protein [Aminicella lysinilytica]TDP53702.1 hypothetical protein EV211_12317 [Aminicella lysinilytica]
MDMKTETVEAKTLDEVRKIIEEMPEGTVVSLDVKEVTGHADAERK